MKYLENIFLSIILIFILYFIINVFHFSWYLSNPEGFWSLMLFWEIFRNIIFLLAIIIPVCLIFYKLFYRLYMYFKGRSSFKELVYSLKFVLLIITFSLISTLFYDGIALYFTKKMSDKYSYLNESTKLAKKGLYEDALMYSKKVLEQNRGRDVSYFFILTKLYTQTDFAQTIKLRDKYAATVNYAFVLFMTDLKNEKQSARYSKRALDLSKNKLLKSQKDLQILPYRLLAEIELANGEFAKAEKYSNIVYNIADDLSKKDKKQVANLYLELCNQAIRSGNFNKASQTIDDLVLKNEHLGIEKETQTYFTTLIIATKLKIYLNEMEIAGGYLYKLQKLSSEFDDNILYQEYLKIKLDFLTNSLINNSFNENIIEKSTFSSIKSMFTKPLTIEELYFKEAKKTLKELQDVSKSFGENNFNYLSSLNQMGLFYLKIGRRSKAKYYFKKSFDLTGGADNFNPSYNQYYIKYLQVKEELSKVDLDLIDKIYTYLFNSIDGNILLLTEEERVNYILKTERNLRQLNSLLLKYDNTKDDIYDYILNSKSIALEINIKIRRAINSLNEQKRNEYYELLRQKKASGNIKNSLTTLKRSELIEEKQINFIKENLNLRKFFTRNTKVRWQDIKSSINKNQVAVEFYEDNVTGWYYAVIIKADSNEPILLKLFDEELLVNVLNVKGTTKEKINKIYNSKESKIYDLVWSPINKYINKNNEILISPDGLIHRVSFPALFSNSYNNVKLVSSTRSYFKNSNSKELKSITLFGDVNYGNYKTKNDDNDNRLLSTTTFAELTYTKDEINSIDSLFHANRLSSRVYSKDRATEKNLYNFKDSHSDILHIATHGMYLDNDHRLSINDTRNSLTQNPLNKSLIILAGANEPNLNPKNDGFISAKDITKMNLSKVNLVVLSACETGLGDIRVGEGVFGLARGFKNAGVDSVLVSLWEIPDKETAEFFKYFYKFLVEDKLSINRAFTETQMLMSEKYDPYYWASFILLE